MEDFDDICRRYLGPLEPIATGMRANLPKMGPCGAILFDVYGTLLVSGAGEIGLVQAQPSGMDRLPELLKRYEIAHAPRKLQSMLRRGIEAEHRSQQAKGVDFPEVDIVRIWQEIIELRDLSLVKAFALAYELITNPVFPMPGAGTLARLCKKKGIPMGIISNAQFYTPIVLAWLFGKELYDSAFDPRLRFYSWQQGCAKPSATLFNRAKAALQSMGIPSESVLYVGNDMRNDIRPATEAGFRTALFAGDRRSLRLRYEDEPFRDVSPDWIVTHLNQLAEAAGQSNS
ncbi:hydrolase [Desulfosarcina widdelii]|uniref:Hydrolase n=1 Tax=Desulfosarcina widdelii TaxID=947919 RepID=A0A5K7Z0B2_9BACT|nr:HAD family hydrolase [Desulfosarcina widdelii]BBO73593.1 hydrolase [Desulfosarcina widdelii]